MRKAALSGRTERERSIARSSKTFSTRSGILAQASEGCHLLLARAALTKVARDARAHFGVRLTVQDLQLLSRELFVLDSTAPHGHTCSSLSLALVLTTQARAEPPRS